mgnify:CR=1 FL=1
MADSPLEQNWNVVTWALSGSYDEDRPVRCLTVYSSTTLKLIPDQVLIDADRPDRSLSKRQAIDLVAKLSAAFEPGSTVCVHLYNDVSPSATD